MRGDLHTHMQLTRLRLASKNAQDCSRIAPAVREVSAGLPAGGLLTSPWAQQPAWRLLAWRLSLGLQPPRQPVVLFLLSWQLLLHAVWPVTVPTLGVAREQRDKLTHASSVSAKRTASHAATCSCFFACALLFAPSPAAAHSRSSASVRCFSAVARFVSSLRERASTALEFSPFLGMLKEKRTVLTASP